MKRQIVPKKRSLLKSNRHGSERGKKTGWEASCVGIEKNGVS